MKCKFWIKYVSGQSLRVIVCRLAGDPLYVSGGQPKCFDPEFIDESFATDG